jgi:hypothetical protein
MLRWHHTVTVGTTQRIPFICEKCHSGAEAVVSVKSAGFATSSTRNDAHAAARAEAQARSGLQVAVPRLAELAACPHCGFRSPKALADAKARGLKLTLGGLAALALGAALTFGLGGPIGWSIGGFVLLFGLILAPVGLFTKQLSSSAADKAVRFELPHPDAQPPA